MGWLDGTRGGGEDEEEEEEDENKRRTPAWNRSERGTGEAEGNSEELGLVLLLSSTFVNSDMLVARRMSPQSHTSLFFFPSTRTPRTSLLVFLPFLLLFFSSFIVHCRAQ